MTFGDLWRPMALEASAVDALLVRQWTQQAYTRACTGQRWGFLRAEGQLVQTAARSVACTVTQGSNTVTSAGLFSASDDGRQFRVGASGMPQTLTYVDASTLTLDRTYEGSGGSATATIFDAYAVLPADFDSFRSLTNPTVQRPMPWMLSREILDHWDPNRTASDGSARMVVSHRINADGRLLYEYWPYQTSGGRVAYPMTYYKQVDQIGDDTHFQGVLATRADALLEFVRYRLALFPGTATQKNPAYNPGAAVQHLRAWEGVLQSLTRDDDDQFLQSIELIDWRWVTQGLPFDSALLRATDASGYSAWGGY